MEFLPGASISTTLRQSSGARSGRFVIAARATKTRCSRAASPRGSAYTDVVSKPQGPVDVDHAHSHADTVEDVLDLVRQQGGRITSSRRLLLRTLFDAKEHRTAEELAAEVQLQAPDIHLST